MNKQQEIIERKSREKILKIDKESVDSPIEVKLSKKRFIVLIVLSLALFANGEAWMTFGSVAHQTKIYYQIDDSKVNWFGNVFLVAYAVEAIPCTFMPQLIGLRWTLVVGCLLNFCASLFRYLSFMIKFNGIESQYAFCLFANILFGLAQGFLLNIPSLVSSVWFSEKERSFTTAFAYMSNAIGVGIGFLDIYLLMNNTNNLSSIYSSFKYLSLTETIFNSLVIVIAFMFVSEKPRFPPSRSQINKFIKVEHFEFFHNLKNLILSMFELVKKFASFCALFIFATYYGCYVAMFIFLPEIIQNFDTNPYTSSGYIGSFGVILGGINTVIIGIIMNKTQNKHNRLIGLLINFVCSLCLSVIAFLCILNKFTSYSSFIIFIIYLTFSPVYITVGCEILADSTYPIDPNISSNEGLIFGNIVGALIVYTLGLITNNYKYYSVLAISIFLYLLNCLLLYFVRFNKARSQKDQLIVS